MIITYTTADPMVAKIYALFVNVKIYVDVFLENHANHLILHIIIY